jgi:hypothetical protein
VSASRARVFPGGGEIRRVRVRDLLRAYAAEDAALYAARARAEGEDEARQMASVHNSWAVTELEPVIDAIREGVGRSYLNDREVRDALETLPRAAFMGQEWNRQQFETLIAALPQIWYTSEQPRRLHVAGFTVLVPRAAESLLPLLSHALRRLHASVTRTSPRLARHAPIIRLMAHCPARTLAMYVPGYWIGVCGERPESAAHGISEPRVRDLARSLAHELGHHVYRTVLSGGAKEEWGALLKADDVKFPASEIAKHWPARYEKLTDVLDHHWEPDPAWEVRMVALHQRGGRHYPRKEVLGRGFDLPKLPLHPISNYARGARRRPGDRSGGRAPGCPAVAAHRATRGASEPREAAVNQGGHKPLSSLDQALRDLLASPEAKRLRKRGRTWTEGECWNLAEALVQWIGPGAGLAVVFVDPLEPEHVVARVGDLYLDGDGVSTEEQLLARAEEQGLDEAEVEPWHKHHAELLAKCGTRREERRIERLAALLERRLGPASRWGLPGTGPRETVRRSNPSRRRR